MRRSIAACLTILVVLGSINTTVMSELGTYNSLAAFLTYEYGDHEVGSEVNVTLHVFKEGHYFDPDGVQLERRESGRSVELERSSVGVYEGSFEIAWEDISTDGMWVYLDGGAHMSSDYSVDVFAAVETVYSRFQVTWEWLEPSEGVMSPGQEVTLEVQTIYQGDFVDPDTGSLTIGFHDVETHGDDPGLEYTRVAEGRFRASYEIPDDTPYGTVFEVGARANLTITIPAPHGDEEYTTERGAWRQYGMDQLDVWAHTKEVSTEEVLIDVFVRDAEGLPVVGAEVAVNFTYLWGDWQRGTAGTDEGITDSNGSLPFTIAISDLPDYFGWMIIEGNVTHGDTFQEIRTGLFLKETRETGISGRGPFSVDVVEEEMSYENNSLWLKSQVMSDGEVVTGTDVYSYTVTEYGILDYSSLTTDEDGFIEVEFEVPEMVEFGSFPGSFPTTYYHALVNGTYTNLEETRTYWTEDPEKYSTPTDLAQTVLEVGPATPGTNMTIEFTNPLMDGIDEAAKVIWSIEAQPFQYRPGISEWTRWNYWPASGTGGMINAEWTDEGYVTNLTVPDFLPAGTRIAIYPILSRLDKARDAISGPIRWVTVSEESARPTIYIAGPADNATVNGTVTVSGTASSDLEVERVEARVDPGDWVAVDGTEEWSLEIDTTSFQGDSLNVEVRSFDGVMYSDITVLSLKLDQPPSLEIADTIGWSEEDGNLVASGGISDDHDSVVKVEVRLDGGEWSEAQLSTVDQELRWTFAMDPVTLSHGGHTFEARAFDGIQYSTVSTLQFSKDLRPTVFITTPVEGEVHRSDLAISGTTTDDLEVVRVDVRIASGDWVPAEGTEEWSYDLDLETYDEGDLTIFVRAFDGTQYSETEEVTFVVEHDVFEDPPSTSAWWLLALGIVFVVIVAAVLYIGRSYQGRPRPPA